jgi:hypothetical protein
MLGLGVTKGSLAGSDVTQPPQKIVVYQSDFTEDVDGWTEPLGMGDTVSAPESSTGGLTDAVKWTAGISFTGAREIHLDLSSFNIPADQTDYSVGFTFEGDRQTKVQAILGSSYGTEPTDFTAADTSETQSDTITATNPGTFKLSFSDTNGDFNGTIFFKSIELYYYS